MLRLYTYFRSSAAYRVRIALALKGLAYDSVPVHLLRGGGEQLQAAYRAVNPAALVPALLPQGAVGRARVRALALSVACDIHPLNNLRVLNYLTGTLQATDAQRTAWIHHWMALGLEAIEAQLARDAQTGLCCHGDTPTLADCCLVPQVFNARRFGLDLAPYPTVRRIAEHCEGLAPFQAAHPALQPDAE